MEQALPYITAALLCERVIEGKDGVLSAIRIIERIEVGIQSDVPALMENFNTVSPAVQVTALIALKSGPAKGKFNLHIYGEKPSGKRTKLLTFPLDLLGGDQGQNFIVNIVLTVDEEGLHWFDVMFEDRLLSKIPITLSRVRTPVEKTVEPQKQV